MRHELIPIISTSIFVSGGEATADTLVRLASLTPFGSAVNDTAVTDVTGMLLLVNLGVVIWFSYVTLTMSLADGEAVRLDAKLIGLGTAFLTSADLVSYGIKAHHPERTTYGLLVLLFLFFVPFFLIRRRDAQSAVAVERKPTDAARHALGAMALVTCAVLPAIAGVLAATLYAAVLNDVGGHDHSFVAGFLGQRSRSEFWGISPGVFGIAWAPLVLCFYRWIDPKSPSRVLGLDWKGRTMLAAACCVVFVVMAVVLIEDSTLLLGKEVAGLTNGALVGVKIVLAMSIALGFTVAFSLARMIDSYLSSSAAARVVEAILFAVAGAFVGLCVVKIRRYCAGSSPNSVALVFMHAGGFVVAYVAGRSMLWLLRHEFAALDPLTTRTPEGGPH